MASDLRHDAPLYMSSSKHDFLAESAIDPTTETVSLQLPKANPPIEPKVNGSNGHPNHRDIPAASPDSSAANSHEAHDYINGGHAHENLSPLPQVGFGEPFQFLDQPPITTLREARFDDDVSPGEPDDGDAPARAPMEGRRSVQFARSDIVGEPGQHSRHGSLDAGDGKSRGASFMSRLKALAVQSGLPLSVQGGPSEPSQSTPSSPTVTRYGSRVPQTLNEEGSDADADAEETADEAPPEDTSKVKRKKRRMRRPKNMSESTPATPRLGPDVDSPAVNRRFPAMQRRATMPDASDHRAGLSEGEGRDQLVHDPSWRRGSTFFGTSRDDHDDAESPSGRRMGHLRRITVFGGGVSDGDAMTPRRPFFTSGDRSSTFGAQRWKQVKNTLKMLRQKKEERFDYFKSAELMAELRAGAPAVLMLASMIQRDEHGNKRIPVLLEQVRLHIRDSSPQEGDSERHWSFVIDLEYGSGPSRMKWTVTRTIPEILNLHWKYKLALSRERTTLHTHLDLGARPKQPRFPLSAFPYLRGVRGLDDSDEEDLASVRADETAEEGTAGEATAAEGNVTDTEGRPSAKKKKSRMNVFAPRRKLSAVGDLQGSTMDAQAQAALEAIAARRKYVESQQRMLEKYLQEMVRWLMFRADSNRLCRFLELSALGVRLAAEGGYHGKECYLHIQSAKGLDFRRVLTPAKVIARHTRKWFLVRQSYIACVESPENIDIYDVYLVDPNFKIITKKNKLKQIGSKKEDQEIDLTVDKPPEKHHTVTILTSERKIKLWARNQHLIRQFEESITEMLKRTPWHLRNRFGSFAPVRTGVYAQWLVDGRDYMWNVSRAIGMAKDVVYIHDWWLSPELYMRRPACISQKWRLDRLLQRKAREGVKIFVIIYRNVEAAIPIDSEYTKYSLLNLHPNIFVQRSPNQYKKNQFFFAHHEKICIVDHHIAFVGGIDLCFGRWDNPQHPIADDKPTGFEPLELQNVPKDAEHCQLFPGKDYSNPRVQDFFRLNEPYEEMYDRSKVPRMPWHDVAMQVVGQPARDLTRHFVQRWNYLRRGRKPTRPLPFLLPPPDFRPEDLEALGLSGTCEVQILRSASKWSLGIEDTEASIQSAYVKMIEESEHFVYMENQFFITSTETLNVKIINRIGDALVERIIRAHDNDEDWRAVIVIPLMPGFQNSVAEQDGSSVRLILQCQYRSICRGESSIFGRLRAVGIEPEDYIQFFSLRQWGKIGNDILTTEQLYIHAKTIIVDDRVALIGSANINERSMLGSRDSECAAVVRDTDLIWSTMGGEPYRVGRFAHTLRLRLMREHLGLDVDEILEEERQTDLDRGNNFEAEMNHIYGDASDEEHERTGESSRRPQQEASSDKDIRRLSSRHSFNYDVDLEEQHPERTESNSQSLDSIEQRASNSRHKQEVEGYGADHWKSAQKSGLDEGRDSIIINGREVLLHNISAEGRGTIDSPKSAHESHAPSETTPRDEGKGNLALPPMPPMNRRTTDQLGLPRANQLPTLPLADDTDIGGPPLQLDANGRPYKPVVNPLAADIKMADIHKDSMRDPLNPSFYDDIWARVAENNTKVYRRVFRCMPDNEVANWHDYTDFLTYQIRFKESQEGRKTSKSDEPERKSESHPPKQAAAGAGIAAPGPVLGAKVLAEKLAPLSLRNDKEESHQQSEDPQNSTNETSLNTPGSFVRSHARQDSRLDIEKAAAVQRALNTPPLASPAPQPAAEGGLLALPVGSRPASRSSASRLEPKADPKADPKERRTTFTDQEKPSDLAAAGPATQTQAQTQTQPQNATNIGSVKRRRRATTRGSRRGYQSVDDVLTKPDAESLLAMVQGHLVQFPYDWLITEENNGNWLYQVDQVAPLQIYN
ncbi:Phospholipase [Pleurostoma richardsiae]|uniref:Phospholipase n=1 Tax=Pleurostoma richardsiae TaxID=41990 RepID=A0AA38VWI5_9PEZI|nr:Phospholipase [Pleurostoma richardsiae]